MRLVSQYFESNFQIFIISIQNTNIYIEIRKAIPQHLFQKNEFQFLVSIGQAISCLLLLTYFAYNYVPLNWMALPFGLYMLYNRNRVLGHECSHFTFSDTKWLNDALGFILHEALLVPYFSLQHSHAIHHAKTNHLTEGETHTPLYQKMKDILGEECFTSIQIFNIAVFGWPLYILIGVSGGSARGFTSHLIVLNKLLPKKLLVKVIVSNLGICLVIYLLYKWYQATSFAEVMALYIGPYLVVNMWLTIITSLQHNDLNISHYDDTAWIWLKGNLCTIDRNYPLWINALHFDTGTTHVLHHLFSELPHYNAREANIYLNQVIGDLNNQDTKQLLTSLYETASLVGVEHKGNGIWKFIKTQLLFRKSKNKIYFIKRIVIHVKTYIMKQLKHYCGKKLFRVEGDLIKQIQLYSYK
ncbi:unnamed protein product [Paramecium sonneborni]|uniref:Fatty acid desaturase domain-containing protein n=1 Tax=Paramecium sonneborni TaxID=65129 RepID=A0A8S1PW09_9CILI|nr:unnamed protein product [Paramecium sonneborni]